MVLKNNSPKNYITDADLKNLMESDGVSLKDYLVLLRVNYIKIILITLVALLTAGAYAYKALDIYKSTTMLKLSKPKGNILEAPLVSEFSDQKSLFVMNEIEILKSYSIRERVANALVDSFNTGHKEKFFLILDKKKSDQKPELLSTYDLVKMLSQKVTIEQKNDLEIINISAESPSPYEAATTANIYAEVYHDMNLNMNRTQMINVRQFLEEQKSSKHGKLVETENNLKSYQEKGGIIALDDQSRALINQLTDFESRKNAARIEMVMAERNMNDYKKELQKQEPSITDYMEKFAIEPYLESLQKEIASYELKKDLALSGGSDTKTSSQMIKIYNSKIEDLKNKRDLKLSEFKKSMLASSSEEVKQLIQKFLESEVRYHALAASYSELSSIVRDYENKFNQLPKRTIDLARLEREKGESEKLYTLLEEKYQEAMINEQSTPGNVVIIDRGRIPVEPFKPNRILIVFTGMVIGLIASICFVLIANYFDNTVQTPDDIEKLNINLLSWIPQIEHDPKQMTGEFEFVVAKRPNSIPSEAYRALRTRIQFSKVGKNAIKTILLTSGMPKEGKTVTSVNLAGSFAIAGKKTLILDCDLRKPRMHKLFGVQKSPGFTDFIFENASFEEIIRRSQIPGLYYITSGIIPPNPAEILGSDAMIEFMKQLKEHFEIIIVDSPPVLAVTDAEIISRLTDVSILIISANTTEKDIMKKAAELLSHDEGSFIGVVLNNFIYRNGYGNYYKNYYYYQRTPDKNSKSSQLDEKIENIKD